jgi:hypothetical protein
MIAAVLAVGCRKCREPGPAIGHYLDPAAVPLRVSDVALLPLDSAATVTTPAAGMTSALLQALQSRQLFHVSLVAPAQDDCPTEAGRARARRPLALEDLSAMRGRLGTDAALLGSVTQFHPYPQMRIGLYLRLVDLRDSRVLWAVDHVWDAADRLTQDRMERWFRRNWGEKYDPVQWRLATMSPAVFEQFVAHEAAATLTPPAAEAE